MIEMRPTLATLSSIAAALALLPAAASARPSRPHGLHVTAKTQTTLTLSWRAARGARSQVRYRKGGGRWHYRTTRTTHVELTDLKPGARYVLGVRACLGACSAWSRPLGTSTRPASRGAPPGDNFTTPSSSGTGGCQLFPPDNPWHEDISQLPVDPSSNAYINSIGAATTLHPDFGSPREYGIPYVVVPAEQALVPINFTAYGDESDPGPYPIPADAPIEGSPGDGDHHVLVIRSGVCRLYELFSAMPNSDGSWSAASGAVWDLNSNALRPDGWTSADAAGLPILPGLVRYDEIEAGVIDHAIRFTVRRTQRGYIHPATHYASSSTDPSLPPMGLRLRLKAGYDISGFPRTDRIILTAMKRYGLIVADNGSDWYFQGAPDRRWSDDELNLLKQVPGSAFEAVQTGPIQH